MGAKACHITKRDKKLNSFEHHPFFPIRSAVSFGIVNPGTDMYIIS